MYSIFSAGNEYEFYDSFVKKWHIALMNIVGCANLCELTRREHTAHIISLVHNILL